MLASDKRLSPTEPTGETGGLHSNSDEVEIEDDSILILHLISHSVTASPQGEAFFCFLSNIVFFKNVLTRVGIFIKIIVGNF